MIELPLRVGPDSACRCDSVLRRQLTGCGVRFAELVRQYYRKLKVLKMSLSGSWACCDYARLIVDGDRHWTLGIVYPTHLLSCRVPVNIPNNASGDLN
jgi:hypothetical protein